MPEPLLLQARYRSRLEEKIAAQLAEAGVSFEYEPRDRKVRYVVPTRNATYLIDFAPDATPIILEAKGWLKAKDRMKLVLIKEQHPELDVRIVFQRAQNKIYKGSPTTYAQWATDHGFKWSDKGIVPAEWIEELKGKRRCKQATSKLVTR